MPYYYPIDYRPNYTPRAESYTQFASVYKDSIMILLEQLIVEQPLHDYSLAPIVTLLLHYVELSLKGIILYCKAPSSKPYGTHNIAHLYKTAIESVTKRFGKLIEANNEVEKFIQTLGKFDNKSQAFRYPETRTGEKIEFAKMDDWLYDRLCTIGGLYEISEKVIGDLDGLMAFVEMQIDNEQEGFRYNIP